MANFEEDTFEQRKLVVKRSLQRSSRKGLDKIALVIGEENPDKNRENLQALVIGAEIKQKIKRGGNFWFSFLASVVVIFIVIIKKNKTKNYNYRKTHGIQSLVPERSTVEMETGKGAVEEWTRMVLLKGIGWKWLVCLFCAHSEIGAVRSEINIQ